MIQHPVAGGLLLCEHVIVEETSRNITPVNCFTKRFVAGFPSEPLSFTALAFLTDGIGEMELTIVISKLDFGEEIYARTSLARFENPLLEYRFVVRVRNFAFPGPGEYQASLLAQDEPLTQRRFRIVQRGDLP